MDNIKIQTTQNVEIEYELASLGDRVLAAGLDYLFYIAYAFIALLFLGLVLNIHLFQHFSMAIFTILYLPILFYHLICETFMQGKSFGKVIMKIKVVKLDGTSANFGSYLIRWILSLIDTCLFTGGVAIVAIILNGKGQRIGDMAAGTTVIKTKSKVTLNETILNKVKPNYTLVFPQVSVLSDNDIAIIKDVMKVALVTNNREAIEKLANKTKAAMGITTNLPHTQFLATVVQDYSYYAFDK